MQISQIRVITPILDFIRVKILDRNIALQFVEIISMKMTCSTPLRLKPLVKRLRAVRLFSGLSVSQLIHLTKLTLLSGYQRNVTVRSPISARSRVKCSGLQGVATLQFGLFSCLAKLSRQMLQNVKTNREK